MNVVGEVIWAAGAIFLNPMANAVLVQSEPMSMGIHTVNITIYCTSLALFAIQQIDTDGITVIKSQRVCTDISALREIKGWKVGITSNGQRIRIIAPDAIIGDVQVCIN